jgi:hypothetical protein
LILVLTVLAAEAIALAVRLFVLIPAALVLLRLILRLLLIGLLLIGLVAVLLRRAVRIALSPVELVLVFLIHRNSPNVVGEHQTQWAARHLVAADCSIATFVSVERGLAPLDRLAG